MTDKELLDIILNLPAESQNIEFKRLWSVWDKLVTKIIETIVAMANTEWWNIILWIDDPEKTKEKWLDKVFWIEENLEVYDEIWREIQRILPPIANLWPPKTIFIEEIGKTIAIINIPKASDSFHSINHQVFMRLQKWNKKLTPQEIIKLSYAKWFEKADKELVDVDFDLIKTPYFEQWKKDRKLPAEDAEMLLFKTWLARKNEEWKLLLTRAAVMLFAEYPTNLMDTKCSIRIYKYTWTLEKFRETPNLIWKPKTIEWPILKQIKDAQEYVLTALENWVQIHSGFITTYKIPERTVKEAITNAVIHRDYYIKRDIEIKIFEDRVEIESPGLFPCNITPQNIWYVRADGYRNDLIVKHLREFEEAPNLDRNEGVQAMRSEMHENNLYPPLFFSYPYLQDAVRVVLLNEDRWTEWDKVKKYLDENKYINNEQARRITGVTQSYKMARLFKKWINNWLIIKIESSNLKNIKYKLVNQDNIV